MTLPPTPPHGSTVFGRGSYAESPAHRRRRPARRRSRGSTLRRQTGSGLVHPAPAGCGHLGTRADLRRPRHLRRHPPLVRRPTDPVALGIIASLVLGKPVGILGSSWILTKPPAPPPTGH